MIYRVWILNCRLLPLSVCPCRPLEKDRGEITEAKGADGWILRSSTGKAGREEIGPGEPIEGVGGLG